MKPKQIEINCDANISPKELLVCSYTKYSLLSSGFVRLFLLLRKWYINLIIDFSVVEAS